MKIYRITWQQEVYIKAGNTKEARKKWEGLDLGCLREEQRCRHLESYGLVKLKSVEDSMI